MQIYGPVGPEFENVEVIASEFWNVIEGWTRTSATLLAGR